MGMNALEVRRRVMMAQPHEATATGAIASFRTDVVSPLPMEFDLVPIQAGTGDPSPENIRPITGHDGFTRTGTGKNLLAKGIDRLSDVPNTLAECFFIKAGTYRLSVGSVSNATSWRYGIMMKDKDGNNLNSLDYRPYRYMSWNTLNNLWLDGSNGTSKERTINIAVDCYIRIVFVLGDTSESTVFNNPQLEIGSVTTDYEYPNIHSYETEFPTPPGTVYGGHVTDNGDGTGTLTVDRFEYTFTGNENFLTNTSAWGQYAFLYNTGVQIQSSITSWSLCKSSHFVLTNSGGWSSLAPGKYMTAGNVYIGLGFEGTKDELKEWLASQARNNTPVQVVCGLTTPVSYTLSLTALQSLIGQNHVWVDNADSVSVEYWGH